MKTYESASPRGAGRGSKASLRIVIVHNYYWPNQLGGAEISVRTLAEGLAAAGWPVHIICLAGAGQAQHEQTLNGVRIHYLHIPTVGRGLDIKDRSAAERISWQFSAELNPLIRGRLRTAIGAIAPDVIHTFNLAGFSTAPWEIAKQMHVPTVHTLCAYYLLCPKGTMMGKDFMPCVRQCVGCSTATFRRRRWSREVTAVAGISQFILDRHLERDYFKGTKLQSVINQAYQGALATRTKKKRRSGQGTVFGFHGRFHPSKGLEALIAAFIEASRSIPQATLLIGGRGSERYEAFLRDRAQCRQIHFLGWISSDEFYRKVDVLVVPSLWNEPLGRVVFEAFAHGVPVLGARRGGIPEMITEGTNGWLFEPSNNDQLREELIRIGSDLNGLMSASKACQQSALHFRRERLVSQYQSLYGDVLLEADKAGNPRAQ